MTTFKPTKLDPNINIHGSTTQTDALNIADEVNQLGSIITGQTGSNASIISVSSGSVIISGLTGMSNNSITRIINISGASDPNNNGAFPIISVTRSTGSLFFT